jgi:predicted alpha-1,2-mannosidase
MKKREKKRPEWLIALPILLVCTGCVLIHPGCNNTSDSTNDNGSMYIENPVDYVNPFVDTHNSRWFYFSSASRPFGMVNLSPDTDTESTWSSGYLYDSEHIRCLSHVHGWQLAGIPVLPVTGKMNGHLGMDEYQSSFTHKGEIAKPGYHKVDLLDYEVTVELTSTTRVGFHKYSFHNDKEKHVLFDLGAYLAHSPTIDTYIKRTDDNTLEGFTLLDKARFRKKPLKVFFYVKLDKPMDRFGTWKEGEILGENGGTVSGAGAGAYASFGKDVEEIQMKVALSYTSIENAKINMDAEVDHWDFERVKLESFDEWNRWLNRIQVSGGTRQQKVKFFTDLWHALQGRRIMSDVNGYYIDNTGSEPVVQQVDMVNGKPKFPHYNFDGLWGAHWTINILWSMAYPEIMDGFINTMLDMYENGGLIPRGPSGGDYTYIMVGDAASFFANAYHKGIRNYDIEHAYQGLIKNASIDGIRDSAVYRRKNAYQGSMNYYLNKGYVPENVPEAVERGATLTLEYAYLDWCVAQVAKSLGKETDYKMLMKRAQNYKNLWNPETRLMHPRNKDGSWITDFNPVKEARHTKGFVEANSAVYTHFVPHDIVGLAELFGGYDAYNDFLNESFEKAKSHGFVEVTKDIRASHWVNYANEPGHGMGHIFNHTGVPYLSQKWIRVVKAALNDTTPYGGYNGDEDQGKAGSLGVLMAIGLFQLDGGASVRPFYEITSPIFDKVKIELNNEYYPGETFVIETKNNSKENMYIQSARLNGERLERCWFYHDVFAEGGTLTLELGNQPNKNWGVKELPPSMSR